MQLQGQVALVTGGAGGVGGAISRALAAGGAFVVVNGRNADKTQGLVDELTAAGSGAEAAVGDVTDEATVQAIIDGILQRHGRLDILVSTVGGGMPVKVADMKLETFRQVMDMNVTALFLCSRAVLPHMIERGYGRILSIGSGGWHGAIGLSNLSAAKSAMIGLTKTIALESAPHGVTANHLVLGHVAGPGWARRPKEFVEQMMSQVPTGNFIERDDIGQAALFLCGPHARSITGQVVEMTGGMDWVGPSIDFTGLRRTE